MYSRFASICHLSQNGHELLRSDFKNSERKLLVLDYDGTLKPFHSSPSVVAGIPPLKLRRILKKLLQDEDLTVAIVSGRPRRALQLWFSGLDIELAAEHGAWTRYGGKWKQIENTFRDIKKPLRDIMEQYVSKTEGSSVEEKDFSLVWHYRNVDSELAYPRSTKLRYDLMHALPDEEIAVHRGDKIIEVKPKSVSKGRVIHDLMRSHNPDFVLCAGDDYTDEDMFQALAGVGYSFKVGAGQTEARYRVDSAKDMLALLEELSEIE